MQRKTGSEKATIQTALGRCLVDGDAATKVRDRLRRREALGISFVIESAVLALLIVSPLMTSVAQPHFSTISYVPFAFGGPHEHSPTHHPPSRNHHPMGYREHPFSFTLDRVPLRPVQKLDETDDPPILISDGPAGFFNPSAPFISGLRPTDPVVRSPDEKNKTEIKRTVKVSEGVQQAQLIARIEPRYPPLGIQTRTQGTVQLRAIISREGRITALEVVSGPPLLVQAALDAVRQWRYRPTILNGEPVEVETSVTVIFRLGQ